MYLFLSGAMALLTFQACQPENRQEGSEEQPEVNTAQKSPPKMIEQLIGEWQLAQGRGINIGGTESRASEDQQASREQTLEFTSEARYIVREGEAKIDSGAYRMNEQVSNLYFESEADENPREFEVQFKGDTLILSAENDAQAPSGGQQQVWLRKPGS